MAIPAGGAKVRGLAAAKPLSAKVDWGLAYEALAGLALFGGAEPEVSYEIGPQWFKDVRAKASPELRAIARRLLKGKGYLVSGLAGLVADAAGRDVPALIARVRADRTGAVKRALLHGEAGRHLADMEPRAAAEQAAELIELWDRDVFAELAPRLEPELKASAEAVRRLQKHLSPERLIVRATRGVEYRREPWINAVTLVPSVLTRPWVDITEWEGVKYFFYPAGAEEAAPASQLAEVYKALGDETRLRILRLLARGATSLTDLAEELGLAKSTVSQHMVVLRSAGLTRSLVGDEGKGYVLNERPDLNELLEGYLRG